MWQVVFSHISVQCRVVYSNVDGLLDGSGDAMTLSSNYFKVLHWCFVASCDVMLIDGWWCLEMFFKSLIKGSGRFPNVFLITFSSATSIPIYDVTLLSHFFFVFGETSTGFSMCFLPWSMHGPHTCCKLICNSHIDLLCKVSLCDIFSVWLVSSFLSSYFCLPDLLVLCGKPTWDICIFPGPSPDGSTLLWAVVGWSKLPLPCVWECWPH